jgi:site-specific recombinase XerD
LDKGLSINRTRQLLGVIKHYFQFIKREDNPALLIKHKKREYTLPKNLLSEDQLKDLYHTIEAKTLIQRRDKVMLGLVIFQGLKREEPNALEIQHLNLDNATVYVPASNRTNARTLELHPLQMTHLMSYIYEFRPRLLIEIQNPKYGKAHTETNYLFFSMGSGQFINNALQKKLRELKILSPSFVSLTQIKESRMSIWVKQNGIRKAQYLSGIKYASSMLRYKTSDIEKLKSKLAITHPMERLKL